MAENLDPGGAPVTVGNVSLITPGLTGVAESHAPGTPGMRAAENSTETLDAALAAEELESQETVELTDTRELDVFAAPTRSTSYDEPAIQVDVPDPGDEWGQVLLASDESGVLTWNFAVPASDAANLRASATRTYLVRRHIPPPDNGGTATRGLVGALGKKILKVLAFKLIDKAAGEVGDYFAGRWEKEKRPYRVRWFGPDNYATPGGPPLDGGDWSRLEGGRALLFVHGTFSQAHSAFGLLPPEFVAELRDRYDGRVFAFDHFTLSHSPEQNVEQLVKYIPDGARLELDVVCHSRGGLVTRLLAERQSAIALGSRALALRSVAFVGTPNAGTLLADADHVGNLVDTYTNLFNFFPDAGAVDVLQTVIAVVKQIAVGAVKGLDGVQSMVPGGSFLSTLNATASGTASYYALASDFQPQSPGMRDWVADRLSDAFFKAENDLVVPTVGVYGENGSGMFPIRDRQRLVGAQAVGHTRYFTSELAIQKLRDWLC